jgi:hypothetical protein
MKKYGDFSAFLASEFQRYVMENGQMAESIPPNALVVFDVAGEAEFSAWHRQVSLKNREPGQPVVQVHVGSLRMHSAFEQVEMERLSA